MNTYNVVVGPVLSRDLGVRLEVGFDREFRCHVGWPRRRADRTRSVGGAIRSDRQPELQAITPLFDAPFAGIMGRQPWWSPASETGFATLPALIDLLPDAGFARVQSPRFLSAWRSSSPRC